jgi:hypothetical protein
MYETHVRWRQQSLPADPDLVGPALRTGMFYGHKFALDGSSVLYFRGGKYDSSLASINAFVLASAHALDYLLGSQFDVHHRITVVVQVHTHTHTH